MYYGSEYIGNWQAKSESVYTKEIEKIAGQVHKTIFPGAHRMQADVETVHNLIEMEFYELEKFYSRHNFMDKAYSYQMFLIWNDLILTKKTRHPGSSLLKNVLI